MYQEILYGVSIASGGMAYIMKLHKENNNVKRPDCHRAQDRIVNTFNTRIDDLKDTLNNRFDDMKDFLRNGNRDK